MREITQKERKEQETLKYLSAMEIIDFNKLGFVYGKETITDTLVLLKNKDIEIEMLKKDNKKKDKIIDEMAEEISHNIINTCPLEDYNFDLDCENRCNDNYKECWKEYFTKKVEDK